MRLMGELRTTQDGREQRRTDRRVLALAVPASVDAPGQSVLIRNLSRTGLMLDTTADMRVGEGFSVALPEAGPVAARVVWKEGVLHGCAFVSPISQAAVSAALLLAPPPGANGAGDAALDERWPGALRLLTIVGAASLLWAGIAAALWMLLQP